MFCASCQVSDWECGGALHVFIVFSVYAAFHRQFNMPTDMSEGQQTAHIYDTYDIIRLRWQYKLQGLARFFEDDCLRRADSLRVATPPQGYNLMKTHDGNGAFIVVDADELDDFSVGPRRCQRTSRCP